MGTAGHDTRGVRAACLAPVLAVLLAALCAGEAPPSLAQTQEVPLERALTNAGVNAQRLFMKASAIVAEETYRQRARQIRLRPLTTLSDVRKTLKSDLLLIRPLDAERYVEFRDVFEVDGTPVRDRQDRLTKLFLSPDAAQSDQIKAIVDESARHNIGRVVRNFNTPLLSLQFLLPGVQPRFEFKAAKSCRAQLGGSAEFLGQVSAPLLSDPAAVCVEFKETSRPTLIRRDAGRDLPSQGRFWIDPATGAVLLSELVLRQGDVAAVINVLFRHDAGVSMLVPVEMRERYRMASDYVDGVATYGRFRSFTVTTGTTIGKPPPR